MFHNHNALITHIHNIHMHTRTQYQSTNGVHKIHGQVGVHSLAYFGYIGADKQYYNIQQLH